MSREERRAYKRMTRKQDPYALPANSAARARAERQQRIRARRAGDAPAPGTISRRFWLWGVGGAAGAGLIAFSLAWPNGMPLAGYIGVAVALAWAGFAFGLRALMGRGAARG
jgi:hypothetical protein